MSNERVKQLRAELDTVDEDLHFAIRRGETETAQECIEAAHILEQAIAEAESLSLTGDGQARPAADPTPWGGPGSDPIADVADAARRDRERGI